MQQTYQDRLSLDPVTSGWLDAYGDLYGRLQRTLYAHIAKGDNASSLKSSFCAQHGLSARQFNAMRMELEGKIASTVELLKLRKKELKSSVTSVTRSINRIKLAVAGQVKLSAKAKLKNIPFSLKRHNALRRQLFGKKRRLAVLVSKAKAIDLRLKAPVPGICFGSRKLFNQQFHLEQTEFGARGSCVAGHDAWKKEWRSARSHQFFLVGSKDETAGNQSCKAQLCHAAPTTDVAGKSTLVLSIRMPPALVAQGAPTFLKIEGVRFEYGQEQVLQALARSTALSYRFHRDDRNKDDGGVNAVNTAWRVFVSTDTAEATRQSVPKEMGVLGVDFNADHLAWSRTDRFGNAVEFGRFDLAFKGKSTGQRGAILSEALDEVFAQAQKHKLPVGLEDLDFAAKKKELAKMGVKYARMLSGLAYAQYRQLACAKAARLGVELLFVDPAYTSVAGSVKYAVRLGRTVHQAAAGVIARRAQGYSEKIPRSGAKDDPQGLVFRAPLMGRTAVLTLPARNRVEFTRVAWARIRRSLTQHCAEQARLRRKKSSLHPRENGNVPAGVLVSKRPLDEDPSLFREPGELLARRTFQPNFPDVPF